MSPSETIIFLAGLAAVAVVIVLIPTEKWPDITFPVLRRRLNNRSSPTNAADKPRDIIKRDKLAQYSVADELLKWSKLRDEGTVTQDEFDEARKSLLGRR